MLRRTGKILAGIIDFVIKKVNGNNKVNNSPAVRPNDYQKNNYQQPTKYIVPPPNEYRPPMSAAQRSKVGTKNHYYVYVVRLNPVAEKTYPEICRNRNRRRNLPCVYVGQSWHTPEERFQNHKIGYKSSKYVTRYGEHLMYELFNHLNPLSDRDEALLMEARLAEDLRLKGYAVFGGH